MATNPYISKKVRSEQSLYEDLVIESLKFYGEDVYYIPREIVNKDTIFADDVPSRFSDAYKIETYIENTEGFDGEGDLFTKFGIELRDQATFVFARRRWKKLIGDNLAEVGFRPREGDIIYLPMSNSMFEVLKVETETPFYQLSQLPTFRLQCELFEYSDEDFDTNIASIDAIEYEGAYQYKVTMENAEQNTLAINLGDQLNIDTFSGALKSAGSIAIGGQGYESAPTITVDPPRTFSLFGENSLSSDLNRSFNDTFLFTNDNGSVELFFYPNAYPSTDNPLQSLLTVGGNGTLDPNIMIWGVNNEGHIVQSFVDELVFSRLDNVPYDIGKWNHIVIGVDSNGSGVNSQLYSYLNGRKILDSDCGRDLTLFGTNGFALGTDAMRTVGDDTYEAFNGKVDEFRGLTGSVSEIIPPRIKAVEDINITLTHGFAGNYYVDSAVTDRLGLVGKDSASVVVDSDGYGNASTSYTNLIANPTINALIGDTVKITNKISTDADSDLTYPITDYFGGASFENNNYYLPSDAETWAGFAADFGDSTEQPTPIIDLQQGGTLSFDAYIDSQSDSVATSDVRFRFEYQSYPDTEPSYNTTAVTVSGRESTNYTIDIPSQGFNTFSSLIMYLDDSDVFTNIQNVQLSRPASNQHPVNIEKFNEADSNNPIILAAAPDLSDSDGYGGYLTSFTFDSVGTYYYQCTVHPAMRGDIVIDNQVMITPTSEFDSSSNTTVLEHFVGTPAQISVATLTDKSVSALELVDGGSLYSTIPSVTIPTNLNSADFLIGEEVTQTNTNYTIKGEVTRWSDSDRILQLAHVGSTDGTYKEFSTVFPLVGGKSNASWFPNNVTDMQQKIQTTAQNKVFDDFEADFLDFSESNPFGDMF